MTEPPLENWIGSTLATERRGVTETTMDYFVTKSPVDGPFPDSILSQTNGSSPGHGQAVVDWMRK